MIPSAIIRQYAVGQQVDAEVAGQDVVLHYMLALLNEAGLIGRDAEKTPGPLLFKGGTALRKCVFGSTGRFSEDIDLDATHKNGFEAQIEAELEQRSPYHEITFRIAGFRYSREENFSGTIAYEHPHGSGTFELQISYRLDPILNPRDLTLAQQSYFTRVECGIPTLYGLDPYEMIGEKIMACNRRLGGSAKDIYDLYLWAERPFSAALVRRLAVLKAWTDKRASPRYDPETFCGRFSPRTLPGPSSKAWCRGACKKTTTASAPRSANGSAFSPNAPKRSRRCSPTRPPTASKLSFASCAMRPASGRTPPAAERSPGILGGRI
jgi:predicted nucleotidyltransferase component of viral defense system